MTTMTRRITILFITLVGPGLFASGCDEPDDGEMFDPDEMLEGLVLDDDNASAAFSCPSGWHYHYTTWPQTGFYYPGQCQSGPGWAPAGFQVCMRSAPAQGCGGQGYSEVFTPGSNVTYWARTESFNGH